MALFGKKKGEEPAQTAPADDMFSTPGATKPAAQDEGVFDFDAIAKDLESNGGASPFDALLSAPAPTSGSQSGSSPSPTSGSAFDFPETASPSATPAASATNPNSLDDLDALFGGASSAPPATSVATPAFPSPVSGAPTPPMPSAPVSIPPGVVAPLESAAPKKKLPLVPILGALGVLALAGGGGYLLTQGGGEETEPTSIVADAQSDQDTPPNESAANTSPNPVPTGVVSGGAPATQQGNSSSPPRPAAPAQSPAGQTSTTGAGDVSPELLTQLKNLWEQGKAAKKAGDYDAARRFWTQALVLKPDHPGFQDSLDKLPKGSGKVVGAPTSVPVAR